MSMHVGRRLLLLGVAGFALATLTGAVEVTTSPTLIDCNCSLVVIWDINVPNVQLAGCNDKQNCPNGGNCTTQSYCDEQIASSPYFCLCCQSRQVNCCEPNCLGVWDINQQSSTAAYICATYNYCPNLGGQCVRQLTLLTGTTYLAGPCCCDVP